MNIRVVGILLLGNLALIGCKLDLAMSEDTSGQAPQAVNDAVTTAENTPVTIAVLANDTDSGGRTLTVRAISQPANGQAVINPDQTVTYTPTANFNGTDSFAYTLSNGRSESGAEVTITVTLVNDPPVRTAGNVSDLRVLQGSGLTSLGLDGLAYSPGPASESNQILTYTVTQVPGVEFGQIVLADGVTVVSADSSYSLEQLQGMQFSTAIGGTTGVGRFSFNVIDNGGTANGGSDTLPQSLTVTVFVPAAVPLTGQTSCYDQNGNPISCPDTGQDGDKQAGVPWPTPRFSDNGNGTVTDNLTGLIWLKNANCFGPVVWQTALDSTNNLANGDCELTDGSTRGQWRLPNRRELFSLGDLQQYDPALSDAAGTGRWTEGDAFSGVQSAGYWSSVSDTVYPTKAVVTNLANISFITNDKTQVYHYVWPVRDGLPGTAPAPVPRTGQTACYDQNGVQIDCAGTGQDGDKQAGVAWPTPRFVDNGNGTVTDQLTALIWLKDANCFGAVAWQTALNFANSLANGQCGLADGSAVGQWRLPNTRELESLIDYEYSDPALSNTAGTGQWTEGNVFSRVQSAYYWPSTSVIGNPASAWLVDFSRSSSVPSNGNKINGTNYVWPVRGGQQRVGR